jgi:HSP20 family protein
MAFKNGLIPWKWGKRNLPIRQEDSMPVYSNFLSLHQEMNRVFDNLFRSFEGTSWSPFGEGSELFQPRVDVTESGKELRISVELPGLEDKDLDVSISNDALTIKGEKREQHQESTSGYYRMERHYGSFHRTIPFPCAVDTERSQATFKRGVLTVVLPKAKEQARDVKKIPIKKD